MKEILLILVLGLASCGYQKVNNEWLIDEQVAALQAEVYELEDNSDLRIYLHRMLANDQRYRNMEDSIISTFGYESDEHFDLWDKIHLADAENVVRVAALLERFGYPDIDSVGKNNAMVPILVIHHTNDFDLREEHFPVFHDAYRQGHIDDEMMLLFLERTYHLKNEEAYPNEEGVFQYVRRIDDLIFELDYDQLLED